MHKREAIYLHALCVLLREEVEQRCDPPADAFDAYDGLAVSPTAVHKAKDAHERALFGLLADLTATVGGVDDGAALPADHDGEASGRGD